MRVSAETVGGLLDRDEELGHVTACVASVRAGAGPVVAIEGPAGIGKTRLVHEAERQGREAGMAVMSARGSELEREFPFGVVCQLLEPAVRAPGAGELLVGAAALAAPVFDPPLDEGTDPAIPSERSFAVLHGLHWLCAGLAERRPLLLAVDDAQWADVASLRFLAYLVRRVRGLPVGIVIASRSGEASRGDELLAEIAGEPHAVVLRPLPLGTAAVAELVRAGTGREPEQVFADACAAVTGGNPFLAGELVRELRERGVEPTAARAELVRGLGPQTIARRVLTRLRRSAGPAIAVARAIAVLGVDAELHHVAWLARAGLDDVAEAADALAKVEIVNPGRRLGFVHPIVRTAIYADIAAGELGRLHAAAARRLAEAGAPPERLASHLLAAEPIGDRTRIDTLVAAARHALARGAPRSAVSYLRRALAEPPADTERVGLLLELGAAESHAGDERAVAHLQEALELSDDPATRAGVAVALGRLLVLSGAPRRAFEVFGRAPSRLGRRRVMVFEGAAAGAGQLDVDTAADAADRLARLHERAENDPDAPRSMLASLSLAAAHRNEPAEQVARLALRALEGGLPADIDRTVHLHGAWAALILAERFDEAGATLEEALALAQRRGSAPHFAALATLRAWLFRSRGALREAEADARLALDAWGSAARAVLAPIAVSVLLESLVEQGRSEDAEREYERHDFADHATLITFGPLIDARGRLRLAQGRLHDALEDFLAAGRHLTRSQVLDPASAPWRSDTALVRHRLGDATAARELAAQEVALAREFGAPRALGIALRAQGLIEPGERGLGRLREAATVLEGSQATLEHARALCDLGGALRRAGRRAEARQPLRRGLDLAHRCGAGALAQRARGELRAAGARPRRPALSGPKSLTASERRVADLAANGMTNRDIAQALFITLRTVETHLTHTFHKLEIRSRTQLADKLAATDPD